MLSLFSRFFRNSNVSNKVLEDRKESVQFTREDMKMFLYMFDDPALKDFLSFDKCCALADKYLISMTFAYFIRNKLPYKNYNRSYFIAALYLAHCIEEDDIDLKMKIIPWFKSCFDSKSSRNKELLIQKKIELLQGMNYRALVSRENCEKIMLFSPEADIWKRERTKCHTGAYREFKKCAKCRGPLSLSEPFERYMFEDDMYESVSRKRRYSETDLSNDELDSECEFDIDSDSTEMDSVSDSTERDDEDEE